ncbi:hypothetical protein [Novosphingobium sp. AP12]|uniref:hypothetical protein n=1 Tax=Novosphingobium sp. AP12 TaxID=1144305 RepID=UPI000271DE0C|nr:hypothetical protein [Novosphingobium sp. AP12]EJL21910.1 hypothetical protein PMI02_04895 [Novosphingobium sp. AP12]
MGIEARALGEVLPAVTSLTSGMDSLAPWTTPSLADEAPPRLSNDQFAAALVVAAAPLPALEMADDVFLAQILRMMDVLPRRADDTVGGKLRHRAYELAIGRYPRQAMEFLVTEALRDSKFFPSTSECVAIMGRWRRDDAATRSKLAAGVAARHERQARFDELMRKLAAGECDQAEIDALDDWSKQVGETRGHLRREEDGTYVSRVRPADQEA